MGIASKGVFNAPATVFYNPFVAKVAVASVTYVTGSHSIKLGMQDKFGWIKNNLTAERQHGAGLQQRGAAAGACLQHTDRVTFQPEW